VTRLQVEVTRLQTELTAALARAQTSETAAASAATEAEEVSTVPLHARMHACTSIRCLYTIVCSKHCLELHAQQEQRS
jgi:hypothetical protein